MGIKNRLEGKQFPTLGPFADELQLGVREEIATEVDPLKTEIDTLKTQLAAVVAAAAAAQQTANAANTAASAAQQSADNAGAAATAAGAAAAAAATAAQAAQQTADANRPSPTPSAPITTPGAPGTTPGAPGTTPGAPGTTPAPSRTMTPTPTPSTSRSMAKVSLNWVSSASSNGTRRIRVSNRATNAIIVDTEPRYGEKVEFEVPFNTDITMQVIPSAIEAAATWIEVGKSENLRRASSTYSPKITRDIDFQVILIRRR